MNLSEKCRQIEPSITLGIDAMAKRMKAEGIDVVGFGAGEPDFNTPPHIIEAAIKALHEGKTKYTPSSGTPELRKAICQKLARDNGLTYSPEEIVVSNGAKHSLFNALQALCNPGDEVLLPGPYWVSYYELIKVADALPVVLPADEANNFLVTPAQIRAAITPKTKALILNSPSNPTGAVYPAETLAEIARVAVEHNLFVISDEIYECLIYEGEHVSIASFSPEIKALTIVVNGLSKSYSMTGWRIGYTASTKEIADVMGNLQSHATSNPNSIAQAASVEALLGDCSFMQDMKAEYRRRRDFMVASVSRIPGLSCKNPAGAFYVFVNVSGWFGKSYNGQPLQSAMDVSKALLTGENCAVVPGEAFGNPNFIRLSYATGMETIEKGMERFARFAAALS